jgi:tetratricopeptide (TPR) repeat protein
MTSINSFSDTRDQLLRLGYSETSIQEIQNELENLSREIDFDKIKQKAASASAAEDNTGLISSLKDLMMLLENRGYYRPDFPTKLIKLLVNGLNHKNENIFDVLDKAHIPEEEKRREKEFLASCAAITQLAYILLSQLFPEVKAASSGPHVFLIIGSLHHNSMIFVDFSIDSVKEIDVQKYCQRDNFYSLKNPASGLDEETSRMLSEYYSFFHVKSDIGLSHNIHNNLGIAYDSAGRYVEAIEELQKAISLDPEYIDAHNNLAVACTRMEMFEEAIKELHEAIRLNPGHAEAHSNLGNIYARLGRYEEAIAELHEAIRLNPSYACTHNNLGEIYVELGRYGDAIKEYEYALRLDPEFPEAYFGLGFAYYNLGSYDRAARALIRAVYLDPELLEYVPEKLSLKVRQGVSRLNG